MKSLHIRNVSAVHPDESHMLCIFLPLPSFNLPLPSCVPGYAYNPCNSDIPYTVLRVQLPTYYLGPPKCFTRFLPLFLLRYYIKKRPRSFL